MRPRLATESAASRPRRSAISSRPSTSRTTSARECSSRCASAIWRAMLSRASRRTSSAGPVAGLVVGSRCGARAATGRPSAASARVSSASIVSSGCHSTKPTVSVDRLIPSVRFASSRSRSVSLVAPASLVSGSRIANSRSPRRHEMSLLRVTRVRSRATSTTPFPRRSTGPDVAVPSIPTSTTESGRPVRCARATSRPSSSSYPRGFGTPVAGSRSVRASTSAKRRAFVSPIAASSRSALKAVVCLGSNAP